MNNKQKHFNYMRCPTYDYDNCLDTLSSFIDVNREQLKSVLFSGKLRHARELLSFFLFKYTNVKLSLLCCDMGIGIHFLYDNINQKEKLFKSRSNKEFAQRIRTMHEEMNRYLNKPSILLIKN
jgi:hypothetical protein